VLACWSGLGYYSRARNLHKAARLMAAFFPATTRPYGMPGVGDYTAAAIASIAFGLPYAVLDGNVMRVIARLTNDRPISAPPHARAVSRDRAALSVAGPRRRARSTRP
jgi:A/G-specific adenine glycosylase